MAELEDWTCEYKGFVMGEPDSAVSIVAVDGLLSLPDVRSSDLTLVQRNGQYPGDDYMNGRPVILTLEVYGKTREEFTRALVNVQAAFMPGEAEAPLKFRFPGVAADRTAYVMARPRKRSAPLDLDFANMVCNVVVELYSTKPYIYGETGRSEVLRSSQRDTMDGGLVFPAAVPFEFVEPSPGPPDPITWFTQYGSVTARPLVTVRNAVNPTIHNDATGTFFAVSHTGSFTIDTENERVYDAQGNDITPSVAEGSSWPVFAAGPHVLRLTHGDALTEATAVFSWQDWWV